MLRDITIGQHFPGNSLVHRFDPRLKLVLTIAYIVLLFAASNPLGLALSILFLAAMYKVAKIPGKMILKSLKPILPIVIFTAVLNLFFVSGEGEPLVHIWFLTIYAEGVRYAVLMAVRVMALIAGTSLLTYTTSPIVLTDAIEQLLKPLGKLHFPVHELAMMMSIALRFIPTLIEETDKIMNAQKARVTEQQFNDYKSKYLDITVGFIDPPATQSTVAEDPVPYGNSQGLEDIDFCLELLHSDIINVAYILELIAELDPYSDDYSEKRKHILDTMIKDAGMRGKAKLIDGFIQKNVDEDKENFMNGRNRADGTNELEERLNQYIVSERNKAVSDLADDEQISAEVLNLYIKEYDYLQKEQPEIIQKALKEKHLGLIKTRKALTRIMERLRSIIKTFNWE